MDTERRLDTSGEDDFQWAAEYGYPAGDAFLPDSAFASDGEQHLLMVLNGLHAGASMPLKEGTYSLGGSHDCDIVLNGPGVAPVHLELVCDARTIALHPKEGAVSMEENPDVGETLLSDAKVVVTIGGIHLGLVVGGGHYDPDDFPLFREDWRTLFQEPQTGGGHTSNDDGELPPGGFSAHSDMGKLAVGGFRKTGALGKFVPITFIIIFIVSALFFFRAQAPDNAKHIADIQQKFLELHLPKPDIRVDAGGFFDITAYVPSAAVKEKVTAFLKALPLAVRLSIYADDGIDEALQKYISKMAFPVHGTYQGRGRAAVQGFVENRQMAEMLESLVKSNVTGLRSVDLDVLQLDEIRSELTAILQENDLDGKVDLQPRAGRLAAQGALDDAERLRWQTAKEAMRARFGGQLDIAERFSSKGPLEPKPGKIDMPIAGVTMQPYPFVTLQDGKVYFKGATLKNGTVIKEIGSDRIIVEIDGQDYFYNF